MTATHPTAYRWPEGTVVEPDGTIVFRPSWESYRSKVLKAPAFLVVIAALNLWRLDNVGVAAVIVGVTVAVSVIGVVVYFRRAITSVGPRGLVRKDLLRSTSVPRERLGDVIFARELAHYDARIDTTLIVTDTAGKKVAMFNGPFWSADQLYAMASALQQPTWQPSGPVSFKEIRARYPKAVSLVYARPFAFAFGAVFAGLAVIVMLLGVAFALTG